MTSQVLHGRQRSKLCNASEKNSTFSDTRMMINNARWDPESVVASGTNARKVKQIECWSRAGRLLVLWLLVAWWSLLRRESRPTIPEHEYIRVFYVDDVCTCVKAALTSSRSTVVGRKTGKGPKRRSSGQPGQSTLLNIQRTNPKQSLFARPLVFLQDASGVTILLHNACWTILEQ